MDTTLTLFTDKLEIYLNQDPELQRRLQGYKTFSGLPDGHYTRARREGDSATVRAVRCYPFGGKSLLKDCEIVGMHIKDTDSSTRFTISLTNDKFIIKDGDWVSPHLTLELSKELFQKAVLGRHRWLWLIGMDDVNVTYSTGLPHSDWVTIFEILVVMQELIEFDPELLEKIEQY